MIGGSKAGHFAESLVGRSLGSHLTRLMAEGTCHELIVITDPNNILIYAHIYDEYYKEVVAVSLVIYAVNLYRRLALEKNAHA